MPFSLLLLFPLSFHSPKKTNTTLTHKKASFSSHSFFLPPFSPFPLLTYYSSPSFCTYQHHYSGQYTHTKKSVFPFHTKKYYSSRHRITISTSTLYSIHSHSPTHTTREHKYNEQKREKNTHTVKRIPFFKTERSRINA